MAWRQIDKRKSSEEQTTKALAYMTPLMTGPVPDGGREEPFGIVAHTSVQLPAGHYRFITTANDGVRLYVDRRKVIDDWMAYPARRNTADVQLTAGRHDLKVEYYQASGWYKLWVRIEPLDPPTASNVALPPVRS